MEDKLTTVLIPQRSYPQIQKALQMSNTPVLALGGNFSPTADSHLVAVQRDEDEPSKNPMNNSDYETQAINIQNKARKGVFMIFFFGICLKLGKKKIILNEKLVMSKPN